MTWQQLRFPPRNRNKPAFHQPKTRRGRSCTGMGWLSLGITLLAAPSAEAQFPRRSPETLPPPVAALATLDRQSLPVVATAATPSQISLTVPSFWWTNEQFGNELIENWVIYGRQTNTPNRADLIVQRATWNSLSYYDRYALVHHFGTVARDYGYNVLVLDPEADLLAAYTCNFNQVSPDYLQGIRDFRGNPVPDYVPAEQPPTPLACQLWLDPQVRLPGPS